MLGESVGCLLQGRVLLATLNLAANSPETLLNSHMLEHNNVASVLDCGVCLNVVLTPQSFHTGLVRRNLLGPAYQHLAITRSLELHMLLFQQQGSIN